MDKEFNDWWNADSLIEDNPFRRESPAFWAWEGWQAGLKAGMKQERALWRLAEIGQEIELGISYEEANPPEPYCKRCGKKLGTEVYDVHTCTPKEIQPAAWVDSLNVARPDCVTDFKYLSVAQIERKEHLQYIALYTATQKKEWVGLTKEEVENWNLPEGATVFEFVQFVEAKLKEKNNG